MWAEGPAIWRRQQGTAGTAVTIGLDQRGLAIRAGAGADLAFWPLAEITIVAGRSALELARRGTVERIAIEDPLARAAFEAATRALPRLGEPRMPRSYALAALVVVAVLVVSAILAIRGLSALVGVLAPMVPETVVTAIDEASVPSLLESLGTDASARCASPGGTAALDRLTRRLAAAGGVRDVAWKVGVWRSPVPNALALPGGTIVVTDTLLRRAGTADAFAGVLAHEIGHVHHRHGLRAVLRDGGLLLTLSLVTGDAGGIVAAGGRALLGAAYSRDAEREADAFSVDALAAAGGDPRALGPFLRSLGDAGEPSGLTSLLSTHPLTADREAAIEARAAGTGRSAAPLMDDADWSALRAVCG